MGRKMLLNVLIIAFSLLVVLVSSSCQSKGGAEKEGAEITDVNIFKETPVWKLALAVKDQNIDIIEKLAKEKPDLLNYQEPQQGVTLLLWAVGMEKYRSAEALLKCGSDPNIAETSRGVTPLFLAAGYSWVDDEAKKDPKYVKLLLQYGADPNKNYIGNETPGEKSVIEPGTSPLMNSISSGLEKTKALVEAGADINYKTTTGYTAAIKALHNRHIPEYAHYLIVEQKAKVTDPYYRRTTYGNDDPSEPFFPVNSLRNWVYELGSEEHQLKMEIVEEFARQGVNYWETEINQDTLEQIKKLYPDTWEEYIKKY